MASTPLRSVLQSPDLVLISDLSVKDKTSPTKHDDDTQKGTVVGSISVSIASGRIKPNSPGYFGPRYLPTVPILIGTAIPILITERGGGVDYKTVSLPLCPYCSLLFYIECLMLMYA